MVLLGEILAIEVTNALDLEGEERVMVEEGHTPNSGCTGMMIGVLLGVGGLRTLLGEMTVDFAADEGTGNNSFGMREGVVEENIGVLFGVTSFGGLSGDFCGDFVGEGVESKVAAGCCCRWRKECLIWLSRVRVSSEMSASCPANSDETCGEEETKRGIDFGRFDAFARRGRVKVGIWAY